MSKLIKAGVVAGALMSMAGTAMATEGGASVYPHGVENFMAGAVPPKPGLYGMLYSAYYEADTKTDANGDALPIPQFSASAKVIAPRFAYVSNMDVWGGDVIFHTIIPMIELNGTGVTPGGYRDDTDLSVGDITIGPGIATHYSKNLHTVLAANLILPTGSWDAANMVNVGKNHRAYEFLYIASWVNPVGFNGDARIGYIFNSENKDTNYQSGDEFHIDYAAGWGLGNGWTVGVSGYYLQQVTEDKQNGAIVPDMRTHGFSIGPSVKYAHGKKWYVTAKYEKEVRTKNRLEGEGLWLKFAMPLKVK